MHLYALQLEQVKLHMAFVQSAHRRMLVQSDILTPRPTCQDIWISRHDDPVSYSNLSIYYIYANHGRSGLTYKQELQWI